MNPLIRFCSRSSNKWTAINHRWWRWNSLYCRYQHSSSHQSTSTLLHYDRDTGVIHDTTSGLELYQTIIGIEIHAQLSIPTKLFSSALTRHNNNNSNTTNNNNSASYSPNTLVHPYDIAYPGTLPQPPSISAIKASILSASALNCHINTYSKFERKHYFYPDLPSGYQVTQQRWPLASDGCITFTTLPKDNIHVIDHNSRDDDDDDAQEGNNKKKKKRRRGKSRLIDNNETTTHQQDEEKKNATELQLKA